MSTLQQILLAQGAVSGLYVVPNSGDYESSSSTWLRRTNDSVADSNTQAAIAFWYKRESTGAVMEPFGCGTLEGIAFQSDNKLRVYFAGGNTLVTTATFTDTANWHHIMIHYDTPNATAGDRVRLWHDGVEVTAFDTDSAPTQNATFTNLNVNGQLQSWGDRSNGAAKYDGLLAEMVITDGTLPAISEFIVGGSPVDLSTVDFGTNGSWLDNAILGTDVSGNGNDWVNTSVVQSSDVPT